MNARPRYGSRSWLVISETALTCPAFSATSAITEGSTSKTNVAWKAGRCGPLSSPNVGLVMVVGRQAHAF